METMATATTMETMATAATTMEMIATATTMETMATVTTPPTPRIDLPLSKKVELIRVAERTGKSQRVLAVEFGVGRTQVGNILRRKQEVLDAFERNAPDSKRRFSDTRHKEVNSLTWAWYTDLRNQNIPCTGTMIQEKARVFAASLGDMDFKASNGWLSSFKTRHCIGFSKPVVDNSAAAVQDEAAEEWRRNLPFICEGYEARNIFNMEEIGIFFRALPDKTLATEEANSKNAVKYKDKLAVVVTCNISGEFLKPVVIGKALKPECFRNFDHSCLPVSYKANQKASMTPDIFIEWIREFDAAMGLQGRKVLLFLDSAPSLPADVIIQNVNLVFFPQNATSKLQPLDQGIIHNFKVLYKCHLLRRILATANTTNSSPYSVTQAVTVLDACQWIAESLRDVSPEIVISSFYRAGFPSALLTHSTSQIAVTQLDPERELTTLLNIATATLSLTAPMSAQEFADDSEAFVVAKKENVNSTDRTENIQNTPTNSRTNASTSQRGFNTENNFPSPQQSNQPSQPSLPQYPQQGSSFLSFPSNKPLPPPSNEQHVLSSVDKNQTNPSPVRLPAEHVPNGQHSDQVQVKIELPSQDYPGDPVKEKHPEPTPVHAPVAEIQDFTSALHWMSQLRRFGQERGMQSLVDLCGQGEEMLTQEVVASQCRARQSWMKDFFNPS